MNFGLMKHHGWSLTDLENMLPFERDIYILLLKQWIKEEQQRQQEQAMKNHG